MGYLFFRGGELIMGKGVKSSITKAERLPRRIAFSAADYKVSFGRVDSTSGEFKLARSTALKSNLKHQATIYKKASKSILDIKVIPCYRISEIAKVEKNMKGYVAARS